MADNENTILTEENESTRIINLSEASEMDAGMYFVTDSSNGTRKVPITKLIDANLEDEYAAAPAKEVGDLKEDLGDLSDLETEDKSNLVAAINEAAQGGGVIGIANIQKTSTVGLVDTYTITMTDDTTYTFTVTNGDASDAKIQGFIDDWLNDHPEATTTVQDGTITMAKLANDVKDSIANAGKIKMSGTLYAGQIFEKPDGLKYCGWPFNNVQYDSELDSVVFLINAGSTHSDNATMHLYMGKMDLKTNEVSITEIGNPTALGHGFYTMGFCINDDGDYLYIDAYSQNIGKSTDKGETWTETSVSSYNSWPEAITQLSNGRYLFWGDGSTKGVWYSDDDCATWTKATMQNAKYEGSFLELSNGVVMCFMRKSTNGTTDGTWNGTKRQESIIISVSEDYGTSWTPATDSVTLLEGCANVATAFYHKDEDIVEVFTTSRYPYGDTFGAVFQYIAKRTDALDDKFGTPKVIRYSKALAYADFGHVGGCIDNNGDMHLMYYDGDSTASGSANYNYIKASRIQASLPTVIDNSSLLYLPYSGHRVDALLNKLNLTLMDKINKIIIDGGGQPDDPDYFVVDGLVLAKNKTELADTSSIQNHGIVYAKANVWDTAVEPWTLNLCFQINVAGGGAENILRTGVWGTWWNTGASDTISGTGYKNTSNSNATTSALSVGTSLRATTGIKEVTLTADSSGVLILYVNGEQKATTTAADFSSWSRIKTYDILVTTDESYLHSTALAFRSYNKALSAAEVLQNYQYDIAMYSS